MGIRTGRSRRYSSLDDQKVIKEGQSPSKSICCLMFFLHDPANSRTQMVVWNKWITCPLSHYQHSLKMSLKSIPMFFCFCYFRKKQSDEWCLAYKHGRGTEWDWGRASSAHQQQPSSPGPASHYLSAIIVRWRLMGHAAKWLTAYSLPFESCFSVAMWQS